MGRRNPDRYTDADWRDCGRTVRAIIENRWPVHSACDACDLVMDTDLKLILEKRGPSFDLWGTHPRCRRRGCPGRVTFYISPPGAMAAIAMTAKPVR